MRFIFTALFIAIALLTFSCDRFEHNFTPPQTVDLEQELFTPLQQALDGVPTAGLDPVMAFYAEDYLHFGLLKSDRRTWLEGIYNAEPNAQADVTLLDADQLSDSTAVINWQLIISTPAGRTVLADSTFIGEELVERGEHWLFRGNQMSCEVPDLKQHVIIEYFTFLGCPNCPAVEAELHDLQLAYPGQLSYLEYHTSGPLVVPGDATYTYYGPFTVPTSVFQGESVVTGSGQNELDAYSLLVQSFAQRDSVFRYTDPVFSVSGQAVYGSISLEVLSGEVNSEDLVLNYVLIERESSYTNTQGEPLRNVVLAKGSLDISQASLDEPLEFMLQSDENLPDDASIVIFAQTRPDDFANDATIHGGVEFELDSYIPSP
jgi:hypothetical protein